MLAHNFYFAYPNDQMNVQSTQILRTIYHDEE